MELNEKYSKEILKEAEEIIVMYLCNVGEPSPDNWRCSPSFN